MSLLSDITDDISKKYFAKYTSSLELPDYVKEANVVDGEYCIKLASSNFADVVHRKFPIDTKANCWTSALYFYGGQHNKNASNKQIETRLEQAGKVWGINSDIDVIKQAFIPKNVTVDYAIRFIDDGRTITRCPYHTVELATKSAEWLFNNRFAFPVSIQKEAATKLMKTAELTKISSKAAIYLDKLACSDNYNNLNNRIASAIADRLAIVKTAKWGELGNELLKVANSLSNNPYALCDNPGVILEALETFDIDNKLHTKWGKDLNHPVDVCYSYNLTKSAEAIESTVSLTTGTMLNLEAMSDSQLEKGLKMAGDDFLDFCKPDGINLDRSKIAEVIPTLPRPEAKRFEKGIKSAGFNADSTDLTIEILDNANSVR